MLRTRRTVLAFALLALLGCGGGATNDLEIPCPLKPGEYEYEVWLFPAGGMGGGFGGMDNPQSRMQGKIVVE